MEFQNKIIFIASQVSLLLLNFASLSAEPLGNYEKIFPLKDLYQQGQQAILASNFETKKMAIFVLNSENQLEKKQETALTEHISQATSYLSAKKNSIAIAFGYGRGDLAAAMSVRLFDQDLKQESEILNLKGERTETTHLEQVGSKLLIAYFESKYFVKTGFLKNTADSWEFVELFQKRLGIHLALGDRQIAIGRPYGDEIGIDGDVLLYENETFKTLPTLRGVRSLSYAQVDADPEMELVVGDGWHQNYGELAEPRLSLIDNLEDTPKLKNVFLAKGEFAIEKIETLNFAGRTLILAAGEKAIWLLDPTNNWASKEIYTVSNTKNFLDFAILKNLEDGIILAILDGNLLVKKITL